MSIFITLGDFFYKIGGKNPGEHESYGQTQSLTPVAEMEPVQAVANNSTPDQYRSFTEIGRQVAKALNYQLDIYSGEVLASNKKLVAPSLEMLAMAMVDLKWIENNSATASPFIDWGSVGLNDEDAATNTLREKIKSYGNTYWQHLTSNHII
ncbi:MAG: hypothetical protein Q4C74_02610 [Rothia sp. (in: high G+C Gram-positive bacteria)]|nr:hypothetical protein [Rothia sp. (in: high G+C Gram-positive bacteria)]